MSLSSYARYSLKEKRTENGYIKPYVVSDVFTNEECGLLSMGHSRLARVGTKKLIKSLSSRDAKIIKEMCLLDSLIVNGDRHDSNYGFIINNNNLKIDRVAPIYDNDMGLGATIINLDSKSFNDAYNELMSRTNTKLDFEDFNTQVIRTIDRGIYGKLLDLKRNPIKFENDTVDLSDRRVDFMSYIVNRRVDDILELINSLV